MKEIHLKQGDGSPCHALRKLQCCPLSDILSTVAACDYACSDMQHAKCITHGEILISSGQKMSKEERKRLKT